MRTSSSLSAVLVVTLVVLHGCAREGRFDGYALRSLGASQVVESVRGALPPGTGEEGTGTFPEAREEAREVRERAWEAARGVKRVGAWLVLGLRVEGERVRLLGVRTLADGSRLLPGSPAHKAQRWIDYQFRHPGKYRHFSFPTR